MEKLNIGGLQESIKKNIDGKCKKIFGTNKECEILYPKGGFRGRNENIFNLAYTKNNGPYTKEAYDEIVEDGQQKTFFDRLKELGALDHKYQTNITSDYDAINKEFVEKIINDPMSLLPDEIKDKITIKQTEGLMNAVLSTKTGCNVDKNQTLKNLVKFEGDKYIPTKTLADIMKENGLRTICSVSGTTTDIVVGLVGVYGKDAMKKILEPFAELVNKKTPLNADEIKKGLNDQN